MQGSLKVPPLLTFGLSPFVPPTFTAGASEKHLSRRPCSFDELLRLQSERTLSTMLGIFLAFRHPFNASLLKG